MQKYILSLYGPQITYCSRTCKLLHTARFPLMREIERNAGWLILTSNKALSSQKLQKYAFPEFDQQSSGDHKCIGCRESSSMWLYAFDAQ